MPTVTTLALETGHNSSFDAAYNKSRFAPAMFDGTPGNTNVTIDDTKTDDSQNPITPGHISAQPVSLLMPGFTGVPKAVHVTPWWGSSSHPNIGAPNFRSNSYIDSFLNEIFNILQFNYIIYDWYGSGSYEDGSVQAVNARATSTSFSAYKYLCMIDKGAIGGTGGEATDQLIHAISYLNANYFGDSRYVQVGGRPVIMLFGVSQIPGINMSEAKAAAASLGNPLFIDEGTSVFTTSWGDGGYSWVNPYNPTGGAPINPADPYNLNYLDGFISAANANPTKYLWLSAWAGFDGTCTRSASWSWGKILQRDSGHCWVKSWANATSLAGALTNPSMLVGVQVPTYDDAQEGSGIESGIENWASVSIARTGTTLSWGASFGVSGPSQTVLGDLSSVYQWKLWISSDQANLTLVENFPTTAIPGFDLTTLSGFVAGTTYYFYVEAEGMPGVRSHMSPTPVSWVFVGPPAITTTSLAEGVTGHAYNQTLAAIGGTTPYTWSVSVGALPTGLSLNASTGAITGTPSATGTTAFTVKVTDAAAKIATQPLSITVVSSIPTLSIVTTSPMPAGNVGIPYSQSVSATGGLPPYAWSLNSGSLPTGLSLNASTGAITGTPSTAGTFTFQAKVTDSQPVTALQSLSITINPTVATLTITSLLLQNAILETPYTVALSAEGGTAPYVWTIQSGAVPSGMTINSITGIIAGLPNLLETSSFTIQCVDSAPGTPQLATAPLSITVIAEALQMSSQSPLPDAIVNTPYGFQFHAFGGVGSLTWEVIGGNLPAGLMLSSSGLISGTPTQVG